LGNELQARLKSPAQTDLYEGKKGSVQVQFSEDEFGVKFVCNGKRKKIIGDDDRSFSLSEQKLIDDSCNVVAWNRSKRSWTDEQATMSKNIVLMSAEHARFGRYPHGRRV